MPVSILVSYEEDHNTGLNWTRPLQEHSLLSSISIVGSYIQVISHQHRLDTRIELRSANIAAHNSHFHYQNPSGSFKEVAIWDRETKHFTRIAKTLKDLHP